MTDYVVSMTLLLVPPLLVPPFAVAVRKGEG
jgi:hypothetical protein